MVKIQILDWNKSSTKIIIVVFVALLSLSAYFIVSSYRSFLNNSQTSVLERLKSISNTLSLQLNPRKIEYLDSLFVSGTKKRVVAGDPILNDIKLQLNNAATIK